MTGAVVIRYRTFRADISLDALENMPARNLRKLFKLAAKNRHTNESAINAIRLHLDETIPEAQDTMRAAARAYEDGWRRVDNPRSRKPSVVEQLHKNDELTSAFKKAHARYERLVSTRKVFDEILAPDTKH
ncbi:MAG: hypothetical protein IKU07_00705 [Oscillospiraceae bacterium]|nr:hypothetical protein [Oscillospiraceae bacterium]